MSILDIFRSKPTGLVCPRGERPMEGHDEAACARRMSRRYFFGLGAGAVAAAIVVPQLPTGGLFNPVANVAGLYLKRKSGLLTSDFILDEALGRYSEISMIMQLQDGRYDPELGAVTGDTLHVRLPGRYYVETILPHDNGAGRMHR